MEVSGLPEHLPAIGILLHDWSLGGTERVAIRLANAWSRLGCRVVVYVGDATGMQRELLAPAVDVRVADPPIRRGLPSRQRLGKWCGRRCVADGIEAAFLPGNFYFVALGSLVAATRGSVRVYAKLSNILWRSERSSLRNRFFAWLTRRRLVPASFLVTTAPALTYEARRLLGPSVRIVEIPNPVLESLPVLNESRRRRLHLCAIGRLVPQKNFSLLLRSIARVTELPVTLDIVGDGEQRERLQALATSLGIAERVRFVGTVHDVQPFLAQAEVLLLTSDFEGYPSVVVEALAAGTYVIARDCSPAMREMLPEKSLGTVVAGDDPQAFAAALRGYFSHGSRDVGRMRELAARHLVDGVAQRYLILFGSTGADAAAY
jgi:glycosyltransferase involved in cell wall biosynthesis